MANKNVKRGNKRNRRERDEFDQRIIDLARVTRVMAGGKRLRFRACVVVGDHKGKLGYGVAKGADVTLAVTKAVNHAKKHLLNIDISTGSIPHQVMQKYKAAQVMLRPAPVGTGIVAGGAVRSVLELSGIKNISAKIFGSNNKVNNVKATFIALENLIYREKQEQPASQADTPEKDNKVSDKQTK